MARNRKQRRAAERKAGAGAGTKTNGNAAAATTPSSELSVTGPAPATAASSSAPRMTNGGDLSRSSSTGSMGQAAVGMDAATPPTLRRAASSSSTTKAGRAKAKDLLPPSPFSPESPVSPTTGSSQGAAAPGLRSAAETSIDTLDDYIPALLATARKGSPAPAATSRSSATESPPPPASYPDPYEHPVAKSPVSPASNVTQSDQAGDASSILRTSILDPPTVTTLFATRTQIASPPIQLTADGKLASRTSLPQALAQARTALVASTYTSSLSSSAAAAAHANQGTWDPTTRRFHVAHARGSVMPRMGQRGPMNARILWPEEGMFLIARGDLYVQMDGKGEAGGWTVDQWYDEVVGRAGPRMRDMYLVYMQLKEAGYMVTRAGHGFVHPSAVAQSRAARTPSTFAPSLSTTLAHFWPRHSRFPTAVALVLRFATLYWTCIWQFILLPVVSRTRLRTLVPKRMPNHTPVQVDQQMHNPTWDYDVWKPMSVTAAKFKPSDPPRPDFAVSVLSAERLTEHGLPRVEADSDGFAEHLVAVVNQASVHFYAIGQRGNYVIGDS